MLEKILAFFTKYLLDYARKIIVRFFKQEKFEKETKVETDRIDVITNRIYAFEDQLMILDPNSEDPKVKSNIRILRKKIRMLEDELRKASIDLSSGLGR